MEMMADAALEKLGSKLVEVITAEHHLLKELAHVLDEISAIFAAILSADARGAIQLTISGHLIHDFKGLLNEVDYIVTMSALPPLFGLPRLLEYAHRLDTKYATMSEYKKRSLVITVLRQASVLKENLPTFRELLNLYSYRTYMGEAGRICAQVQPKDVVLDIFLGGAYPVIEYLGREYSGLTFLVSGNTASSAVREGDTDVYAATDTNGMLMIFTVYFCFLCVMALNVLPQSRGRGQVSVVFRGLPFPAVFQSSFVLAISLALSAACGGLIVRGSSTLNTFYAYLAALSMAAAAILLLCSFSSLFCDEF